MTKTVVVGAGGGGIASALLSALRGEEVILVEAHSYLGGCASFFSRGQFVFDVGATTISGVGQEEPLGILFELLQERPRLVICDPGIVFHLSNGQVLSYYRDFNKWMEELKRVFPTLEHAPFWRKIYKINKEGWKLLSDVKDIPSALRHPEYVKLLPNFLLSTELALKDAGLDHPLYKELIDGILLISAQATSSRIPFFVGAMALAYPSECFAPIGGMKGLMEFFEQELLKRNVNIIRKKKVVKVLGNNLEVSDGSVLKADRIVLNLPVWNIPQLFPEEERKLFMKASDRNPGFWGALTLYMGVRSQEKNLYHQVHLKDSEVSNYFVSFSLPDDTSRAPAGWQAVTISTHVQASDWHELSEEEYQQKKAHLGQIILNDFLVRFKIPETKFYTVGTPRTFEHFTGRSQGFVGGLPFLYGKNPLKILFGNTFRKDVFRIGDSVFPGQGLCGVVAGALRLNQRMK